MRSIFAYIATRAAFLLKSTIDSTLPAPSADGKAVFYYNLQGGTPLVDLPL